MFGLDVGLDVGSAFSLFTAFDFVWKSDLVNDSVVSKSIVVVFSKRAYGTYSFSGCLRGSCFIWKVPRVIQAGSLGRTSRVRIFLERALL